MANYRLISLALTLYEQAVPAVIVAIPDQAEYEPARKVLG